MSRPRIASVLLLLLIGPASLSADETRQINDRLKSIEAQQVRNAATIATGRTVEPLARQSLKDELSALCEIEPSEFLSSELIKLAECCLKSRRFDDCVRYTSVAALNDPSDDSANSLLIKSLVSLKRFDDAAAALKTAKLHVAPKSRVRGLHSLIYFQLAAHKEWHRAVPHIEEHIQHLSVVATTLLEEPAEQHFWVDQLALAYMHTISDESNRQQKLHEHWQALTALWPIAIVPWREASLRRRCAVLELQCAIEVHVEQQKFDVRLGQWIDTILESCCHLRDQDLANETTSICLFIQTHGRKLDSPARANLAGRLQEIEVACFRACPSKRMQQSQATLSHTRGSLNRAGAIKPFELR